MENSKLIGNYASALFSSIQDVKERALVLDEMRVLTSSLEEDSAMHKLMTSPLIPLDSKLDTLEKIIKKIKLSQTTSSFLKALLKNSRGELLKAITCEFENLLISANSTKRVKIVSARPIKEKDLDFIKNKISQEISEKNIEFDLSEDKKIIGGLIISYDSRLIDCSILGALRKIDESIKG